MLWDKTEKELLQQEKNAMSVTYASIWIWMIHLNIFHSPVQCTIIPQKILNSQVCLLWHDSHPKQSRNKSTNKTHIQNMFLQILMT